VDASDADVADAIDRAAESFEGDRGFLGDGDVGGTGAYNGDGAGEWRKGLPDDGDAPGRGMEAGVGELGGDGVIVLPDGTGTEDDAIDFDQGAGDGKDLLGKFSGAEDDFGEAPAGAPSGINAGKTEIDEIHDCTSGSTRD